MHDYGAESQYEADSIRIGVVFFELYGGRMVATDVIQARGNRIVNSDQSPCLDATDNTPP